MTKVFPNAAEANTNTAVASGKERLPKPSADGNSLPVSLTVWKKSLLFNCDGFTVFDARGNLIFRVDIYMAGSKGEIVLMDASGKSLLTIRRKKLSLADQWLVFNGETAVDPRYSVRKHVNILNTKSLAHVSSLGNGNGSSSVKKNVIYEIEGSYTQRCCAVYDDKRQRVAEIKRKESPVGGVAFGVDVFRLIVQPGMELPLAMAFVIMLDQMFGSSSYRRF